MNSAEDQEHLNINTRRHRVPLTAPTTCFTSPFFKGLIFKVCVPRCIILKKIKTQAWHTQSLFSDTYSGLFSLMVDKSNSNGSDKGTPMFYTFLVITLRPFYTYAAKNVWVAELFWVSTSGGIVEMYLTLEDAQVAHSSFPVGLDAFTNTEDAKYLHVDCMYFCLVCKMSKFPGNWFC